MSRCLGLFTSPSTQVEGPRCLQKSTTKASLFVVSLLFAGGAIVSHFAGLGTPGIVAFSIASGVSATAFIIACAISAKNQPTVTVKTSKETPPLEKKQEQKTEELTIVIDTTLIPDLIKEMVPFGGASEKDEENQNILNQLSAWIYYQFRQHAQNGADAVALALRPIFTEVKGDINKLDTVLILAVLNQEYSLLFITTVLEKLDWPDNDLKAKALPAALAMAIENYFFWQTNEICLNNEKNSGFWTNRLIIDTQSIFGKKDFVLSPEPIPDLLVQSIAYVVWQSAKNVEEKLQNNPNESAIGIQVVLGQYDGCRFGASMAQPILSYLKKIPYMVGLDLLDIGICRPGDSATATSDVFKDEHAEMLLEVFKANSHLIQVGVNTNGMTTGKRQEFIKKWEAIWEDHSFSLAQDPLIKKAVTNNSKSDESVFEVHNDDYS